MTNLEARPPDRFRELLNRARTANVALSPINAIARTQRLMVEWNAGGGADAGLPVAVRVLALTFELASDNGGQTRAASMSLALLAIGLYVIETEFADGSRQHLAFRIS